MTAETTDAIAQIVLYGVMGCWCLFAVVFLLRKRPARGTKTRSDWKAMVGMAIQGTGYAIVWFLPLRRVPLGAVVAMPRTAEIALGGITIAMALASVWMVNAAIRELGTHWALAARLVEGHKLIMSGPYRLVRNPIYTGMLGMLIATGLAVTKWQALLAAIAVFLAGTWLRVRVEERLLRGQFGAEFDEYTRRVPAVIPGIW